MIDVNRRRSNTHRQEGARQSYAPTPVAQNPITPSPYTASRAQHSTMGTHGSHPRNPYARRPSDANARSSNTDSRTQSARDDGNVIMGREWGSVEQHPHLARRKRQDRQFGTALEIISGRETEEEDIPQYETALSQQPVYKTIHNPTNTVLELDDDDDDDELLSYVAFSKKST